MKTSHLLHQKYTCLLHDVFNWVTQMAILEEKTEEGTAGPRKSGGQHKCLSCMVIFRCNEDWFAMINPIKHNIGLSISSEPSPESLQIVQNFGGRKLFAVYANQTNLNVIWRLSGDGSDDIHKPMNLKFSTKLGGQAGGQAKFWGCHGPPKPPLRTATG